MVQVWIPLSHGAAREFIPVAESTQSMDKLVVIIRMDGNIAGAEPAEIPFRLYSRRNMEIVSIHDTVGGCDHHCIRPQGSGKSHGRFIRVCRRLYLLFFAASDLRKDDRRMRHHHGTDHCHFLFLLFFVSAGKNPSMYLL